MIVWTLVGSWPRRPLDDFSPFPFHNPNKSPNPPRRCGIHLQLQAHQIEPSPDTIKSGGHRQKRRTSSRQAVVAKSSAPAAAAGVSAMITRSKLVEQLRDYQIRSQHK